MRYVLLLLVAIIVLGAGVLVWLDWYPAIPPIPQPAHTAFADAAIERGATLAALGNCMPCHTAPDGAAFAGGRGLQTLFGTVYASNITPDPATGIGNWSEAAFQRAMRQGVDRRGHQLYPAFPYDHFAKVSAEDDEALYAYLMTRQPVQASNPPNDLSFPFDHRFLIAGWKVLFFRTTPFHPDPARSAAWNRGAYLVQGLAHCGSCHTPRNVLGAEEAGHPFAGGEVQGWYAYALDKDSPAPTPWTADTLYAYLRHGWQAQHGDALGPMRDVTDELANAPDDDVRAIATYIAASLDAPATPAAQIASPPGPGAALYRGACESCHDASAGPPFAGIDLARSSAPRAPSPANLANIITGGIPATGEQREPIMPGFDTVLTRGQTEALIVWLRTRFGTPHPGEGVADAVRAARATTTQFEAAQ